MRTFLKQPASFVLLLIAGRILCCWDFITPCFNEWTNLFVDIIGTFQKYRGYLSKNMLMTLFYTQIILPHPYISWIENCYNLILFGYVLQYMLRKFTVFHFYSIREFKARVNKLEMTQILSSKCFCCNENQCVFSYVKFITEFSVM